MNDEDISLSRAGSMERERYVEMNEEKPNTKWLGKVSFCQCTRSLQTERSFFSLALDIFLSLGWILSVVQMDEQGALRSTWERQKNGSSARHKLLIPQMFHGPNVRRRKQMYQTCLMSVCHMMNSLSSCILRWRNVFKGRGIPYSTEQHFLLTDSHDILILYVITRILISRYWCVVECMFTYRTWSYPGWLVR